MSDSDDYDISSMSSYSYISTDSSSMHCLTPRRFVDLITEKLRSMQCAKKGKRLKDEETVVQKANNSSDSDENSSESDNTQKRASLLQYKLERMHDIEDWSRRQKGPTVKKVTFPFLPTPGCSNENIKQHTLQPVPSTSGVLLNLPSTSNASKDFLSEIVEKEGKPNQGTPEHLLLKSAESIFVLNFPDLTKLVDDGVEELGRHKNTDIEPAQCAVHATAEESNDENIEDDALSFFDKLSGKLKVYESGRVTIAFGKKEFKKAKDVSLPDQEVARVGLDEATTTSTIKFLGIAKHYIDAMPQMEKNDDSDIDEDKDEGNEKGENKKGDTPDEKNIKMGDDFDKVDDKYEEENMANEAKEEGVKDNIDTLGKDYLKMKDIDDSDIDEVDDKLEGTVNDTKEKGINEEINASDEKYINIEDNDDSHIDEADDKYEGTVNNSKEGAIKKLDTLEVMYLKLVEDDDTDIDDFDDMPEGLVNDVKEGMNEEVLKPDKKKQKISEAHSNDETGQYMPDEKKAKYGKREFSSL